MALKALTNLHMNDYELLLAMEKCARKDGTILAADVAEYLGVRSNGKRTPAGTVSIRFSWMASHKRDCPRGCKRHFGLIERIDPRSHGGKASDPPLWVITQFGRELIRAKLTKGVSSALGSMRPGEQLLAMRQIAQRGYIEADQPLATALRREWLNQSAKRRR